MFFFETWMQTCMPEEGKILNPDHPCFRPDSTKVESLVALLNNSSEIKLVSVAGRLLPGWWWGQALTPPSAQPTLSSKRRLVWGGGGVWGGSKLCYLPGTQRGEVSQTLSLWRGSQPHLP